MTGAVAGFIVFLIMSLLFAAISGRLEVTGTCNYSRIFRILSIICTISSTVCVIVALGPDKSHDGTESMAALSEMAGGWSNTLILCFVYSAALNISSMGVKALTQNITKKSDRMKI